MKRLGIVNCCPICIITQQHVGSELSFIFSRFTSTMDHYIHQTLHHQIIPNTFHHFQIDQFETTNQVTTYNGIYPKEIHTATIFSEFQQMYGQMWQKQLHLNKSSKSLCL